MGIGSGEKVGIRDVARAAGVSVTAVSFALNGKPGVSEESRNRILRIAGRLGYRPDAEMVKLMARVALRERARRGSTLAVLTGFERPRPWEGNTSLRLFWEGARARADELGYSLEEFWYLEPGMTAQRLRTILRSRGIEGLLLAFAPMREDQMHLDFDFTGFASAMSGISILTPEISFVLPDHFHNTLLALRRAYELGYRRPLLSLVGGTAHRTQHFMEGAYLYFCSVQPDVEALPIYRSDNYLYADFDPHARKFRPDVIICTQGDWARFVREWTSAAETGWIALGTESHTIPGLAGIDRRLREQAGAVVDVVVAQIHRGEYGVPALRKEILVPGRFVEGASLPDRRQLRSVRSARGPKK